MLVELRRREGPVFSLIPPHADTARCYMPHRYELILTVNETGEEVSLSGEFSDSERELLERFLDYTSDLLSTKFIQSGEWGQLDVQWDRESGTKITAQLPPWDDVIIFLHKFRPLLLANESTEFYKIHNLLARKLAHPHIRGMLSLHHRKYSGRDMQGMVQFSVNEVLLNSEKVLFDWLNSHEYHREEEKREFINNLHQVFPLDGSKVMFLGLLTDKALAVFGLADFIEVLLGSKKEADVEMRRPSGSNEQPG